MNTFRRYGRTLLMTAVLVTIAAGSAGAKDITAEFKDADFKAWVYGKIGKTAPAPISDSDVSGIDSVVVYNKGISDLSGIEYFTALTVLYCYHNPLTALDVSKNAALTVLQCYDARLTALDVSKNTALTHLDCDGNSLTALDVSKNTALKVLDVSYNYFANESDIIGLNKSRLSAFKFDPQRTWTEILASSRLIPSVRPEEELSSIAPVSAPSAVFAVGPNPVSRSSGAVGFFRSGASIKSADLSVYDASGNVVRKISVNAGDASGGQSSRKVGSWDLRDGKGRLVSEGTYLVRGAVKTKDGKLERVEVVVGVR